MLAVGLAAPASAAFTDVPAGSYYEDAVDWMEDQAITTGTTATTFSPLDDVTRAQFATFLWRFAGEPDASSAATFVDVPSGEFYTEAVAWLAETGITTGTTATTFSPAAVLDRAQAATFFWRYMCEPDATAASPFNDVVAGSYYEEAVNWMAETGITTGTTASTFSPATVLDRAQTGTFMHRLAGTPAVGDAGANRAFVCGDGPTDPPVDPPTVESDLLASVSSVAFSATGVSAAAATKPVTLTNDGDADIIVSAIGLSDTSDGLSLTAPSTPFTIEAGASQAVTVAFDPARIGATSASLAVDHNGANGDLSIPVSATGVASVEYRVNAGGPLVPGSPVWKNDAAGTPAAEHPLVGSADKTTTSGASIDMSDASIPSGTPAALFADDRYDNSGGLDMDWDIPVDNGTYLVRLYFAELFHTADGMRAFDVAIEGDTVIEGYDVHADVGANAAVAKAYVVDVADANLDIDFTHDADNPAVAAIEVLAIGESSSGYAMAVPTFNDFGSVAVTGGTASSEFAIQNLGVAGDASITISGVVTSGAAFTSNFSGPVVIAPGASATFDIEFDPSVAGTANGQALVSLSGTTAVIPIGLTGFGVEGTGASLTVNESSGNINASTFSDGSFVVVNTSEAESITEIVIDLRTAIIPDIAFDKDDGNPAGDVVAKDFTVDTSPGPVTSAVLSAPVGDGDGVLTITYAAGVFAPGETLAFSIDIDPASIKGTTAPGPNDAGSVTGLELTGSTVSMDFSTTGTLTGKIFGDGSVGGGGLLLVDEVAPTTPVITIGALASGDPTATASQTVTVTGAGSGDAVELLHVEVGLYTAGAIGGVIPGPNDGNSVINDVNYDSGSLSAGTASFGVTLVTDSTLSNENPGLNYFIAKVTDPATGRTSVSNVFILDFEPV